MDLVWEYLNKVAEDSANGVDECQAKDPSKCWKHGNKMDSDIKKDAKREGEKTYVLRVGYGSAWSEEYPTTAVSVMEAVRNVRHRASEEHGVARNSVWVDVKKIGPLNVTKFDTIYGDEKPSSARLLAFNKRAEDALARDAARRSAYRGWSGDGNGGAGGVQPVHGTPHQDVPGGVRGESDEGRGSTGSHGVERQGRTGKIAQGTFQFDEVKGKVLQYLKLAIPEAEAEDEWVDSGDGNFAWKKPKRKTPFDRLPKKRIQEIIAENVSLIKTIDSDMLPKVASRIYRVLAGRLDPYKFVDWLEDKCDVSEARAYLIATDQIRKAKERIKIDDWINRGIEFAIWRHHAGVDDPREYHMRLWDGKSGIQNGNPNGLDGFPFRLKNPPIVDKKTGERGYPSTLIGCKCYITGIRD